MDILRQYVDIELALRFVSYAIVVGAAVVKLPQIINILRVGSARGLSLPALYLETVATLAGTIYNVLIGNPFRTYGETALILVQNLFIVLLVWNKSPVKISASEKLVATSVLVGVGAALWNVRALEPDWPAQLKNLGISPLDMVYNFMTALFIVARVPQINQNYHQGHTGVLSVVTLFMNVGGNAARIATSIKEGLANVVIYSFVLNLVLNIILFVQVLYYWNATAAVLKAAKEADKKTTGSGGGKKLNTQPNNNNNTPATPKNTGGAGNKGTPSSKGNKNSSTGKKSSGKGKSKAD